MKALSLNSSRLATVGRFGFCLSLIGWLLPTAVFATDSLWENSGTVTTAPQIDATNFLNTGTINIFGTLPFETSNTRNYTNSGTMSSAPGWFFDDSPAGHGVRQSADSFDNLVGGTVSAFDAGGFFVISTGGLTGGSSSSPSYLWVDASNVVNKGTMSVGGNGWLKVVATNVDMARGALEVTALQGIGSTIIGQTNFINDVGINDIWWGQTNGFTFNSANVYNGNQAVAPPHFVQIGVGGGGGIRTFSVPQPFAFGYSNGLGVASLTLTNSDGTTTNIFFATNVIKQAVFVGVGDPTVMSAAVTFFPSSTFTNPFQTVCVQLALHSTNVITGNIETTPLFFYDTLASETNRGLSINISGTALPPFVTERPANYDLSRVDDGRFAAGIPGNISPDPNFLYDPLTFSNNVVTGEYAGYAASVDNLASEPPAIAPGNVTNFPGRVQIYADNLDLRNTRIRGEGEVIVKANHLLSSAGAAVDCENLSYVLGATNGHLNVSGLSKQSVIRLKGNLFAWSGLWSNQMNIVFTNNFSVTNTLDTNGIPIATNATQVPITNSVTLGLYALVLDGTGLASKLPVITWDLITHSTNVVLSDSLNLVDSLLIDGQSLTIDGNVALTSTTLINNFGQGITTSLNEWVGTNSPNLQFFTNNGSLTVPSEAHFGDDIPNPYTDFVNTGSLSGGSVTVNSSYIENDGLLSASVGPLDLTASMGLFQNGQTTSRGDLDFFFSSLKFNNHQLAASGAINFNVSAGLSDAGPLSSNLFRTQNGFNLPIKPATGDLLGTTIQDAAPNFVEVDHVWAGADRGASASGYSDNTAIGKLILTTRNTTAAQAPLFFFTGTNGQCGLYVDLLDLTSLGSNYLSYIQIDPSITIYYAAANLGFTPPPNAIGIPQEPEEFLNGQFGGHLVWVSSFAGPNSSVDVVINGVTVSVNRALRFSKIIDSNGNGIPNFYDPFPFNGAGPLVLKASYVQTNSVPTGVAVSWTASPQTSYQVEYSTDIVHGNWQALAQYTHTAASSSTVTIWDTNAPAGTHRFYRVKTMQ